MKRQRFFLYGLLSFFFLLPGCAAKKDLTLIREEAYQAYDSKDYNTAITQFEILVENVPEEEEFWFRLGNSYARSEKPQLAVRAYQNALLRDSTHEKAWYNMGITQLQIALKTFVDMQSYVEQGSSLGKRGTNIRKDLFHLLENKNEPPETK